MKRTLVLLFLVAMCAPCAAEDFPIDLERAQWTFKEAQSLSARDKGRLWDKPLYGPMLFVDPGSRRFVANETSEELEFEQKGEVFVGTLPGDMNMANTAVEWGGKRWTMLIWPLPEQRYDRRRLLAHEMFHRIQSDIGLAAVDGANAHLETRDGRTFMRLEWRALREALIAGGGARRRAVEDALVFRNYRHALFPDNVAEERALEMNEGLAEYTGFKASTLPSHVLADRAAVVLDDYDGRPNFVRNFAYASGPAYGILLDATGVDWRERLTPESDLGDLTLRAYSVTLPEELDAEAQRRLAAYDGQHLLDVETARGEGREAEQAVFRARFVEGPTLTLAAAGDMRYSFNPNAVKALADKGMVYLTSRVTDAWGVLEVNSGGVLQLRKEGSVAGFVVPAPADPAQRPLSGDGWTLELAEGWRVVPGEREGDWVLQEPKASSKSPSR